MLALQMYRAGLCPHCKRPLRECADPESDGKWRVPPPTRCHATTALSIAAKQYDDTPQADALLFRTERR